MMNETIIKTFDGKSIRIIWSDELQVSLYSVVDVVAALTSSKDATAYWRKFKQRMKGTANETVTNCHALKMLATDGKMRVTDVASKEQLSDIVMALGSSKSVSFIQWLERTDIECAKGKCSQTAHNKELNGEIVLYQADESVNIEVRLENDTVWLTQAQIVELFQSSKGNISEHIANIYDQEELEEGATVRDFRTVQTEGGRLVTRTMTYYNLDVIISVGFRVNAKRGVRFRQWANRIIKDHLLRGYSVNQQMLQMEYRLDERMDVRFMKQHEEILSIKQTLADHQQKIDFFVRTNQPPVEGVLFEGQIFDAYKLVEALIMSAHNEIILIDNYIDATVFDLLEKRSQGVNATIYTEHVGHALTHLQLLNEQQFGRRIEVKEYNSRFHDRFLVLDDSLYHFGASFKDLGKRLFAFELMGIDKSVIINQL